MQNRPIVRVRSYGMSRRRQQRRVDKSRRHLQPAREPSGRAEDWRSSRRRTGGGARGELRRAARLYPQPGRPGARHQPLDPPPPTPVHRDDRAALGHRTDPRRRTRASRHRTATDGTTATRAGDAGTQTDRPSPRWRSAFVTSAPGAGPSGRSPTSSMPNASRLPTAVRDGGRRPCAPFLSGQPEPDGRVAISRSRMVRRRLKRRERSRLGGQSRRSQAFRASS